MRQPDLFHNEVYHKNFLDQIKEGIELPLDNEQIRLFHKDVFDTLSKRKITPHLIDTGRRTTNARGADVIVWKVIY
tara:strand:- start:753 stop:980 length:228 start_codon:yes stop_codon:yes gene_type:complete